MRKLTHLLFVAAFLGGSSAWAQSPAATTTSLAITSGAEAASSVSAGAVVTLTATVHAGVSQVTLGQVQFCDATAKDCTDIHLLGMAQLVSAGTATLKFRPGLGSHSYKAVFAGTNADAGSASPASELTVTGTIPPLATMTTVNQAGGFGAYTLSTTVTETGNTAPPTGTVSFLDTNHGHAVLGSGSLGTATRNVAWTTVSTSAPSVAGVSFAAADLNGDGFPDVFVKDYFGTYDVLLGNGDGTFTVKGAPFGPSSEVGSFVTGDFNGDGIPDVAAVKSQYYAPSNTITIFLGNGDGTFTAAAASPSIGSTPNAIATADVNSDGIADLIVSQQDSLANGQLLVFFGKGDGTFTAAGSPLAADLDASQILVGDLNGDGKIDLILSGPGQNGISILLGKGDGTFTSVAAPASSGAASAALADVNGDGILDLIFPGSSFDLNVYLGNGDGTFTAAPGSPNTALQLNGEFMIADFNQDGIADIAYLLRNSSGVGILFGNGDGSFTQSTASVPYPQYSGTFVTSDFNGDGVPDLMAEPSQTAVVSLTQPTETASASAAVTLTVPGNHLVEASYPGDSNYTASASSTITLLGTPVKTATTLTLTAAGTPATSVLPGTAVTLTASVSSGSRLVTAGQVAFCDASATSCTDIHLLSTVALSSSGTAAYTFVPGPGTYTYNAVYLESGFGQRSASAAVTLTVGPAPAPVYTDTTTIVSGGSPGNYSLTATVVGDGGSAAPTGSVSFVDTTFGNNLLASASLGSSTASLGWQLSSLSAIGDGPVAAATADFNHDGIPDVAVLYATNEYGQGPYSLTVFTGTGNGAFSAGTPASVETEDATQPVMITGDFNGDGKPDVAIFTTDFGYTSAYVTTLLSKGDGTFAAPVSSLAYNLPVQGGDVVPGSMVAADFNGDGKLDLALAGDDVSPGGLTVVLGKGDGTFQTGTPFATDQGFSQVGTGDFNGDGIPDLVAATYLGPAGATVYLGKGDGTFTPLATQLPVSSFPSSVVVGDFNGDGKSDLVFGYTGGIQVFLGQGDGTFQAGSNSSVQGGGLSLLAGDFNHDGILDVAGVDNYGDQIDLFLGAGDGTFNEVATSPQISQNVGAPFAIVSADFNHDGRTDLVVLDRDVTTPTVLLTEPTETATASVTGIAPVGAGVHNVQANYAGDSNYGASSSSAVSLTAGLKPVVISPSGGTFTAAQTVTLTEPIAGATIMYSISGTQGTQALQTYQHPLTLNLGGTDTIYAYATETGYQASGQTSATFVLNLPIAPTPVISPAPGSYPSAQTISITDAAPGATIYYTTNGSYPTQGSAVYSGPFTLSSSGTVAAIALAGGYSTSAFATAQYFIGSSQSSYIYTIAGNESPGYSGDGGPSTVASLDNPSDLVIDSAGNLYFSDTGNSVVRKVAAGTGIITTVAGTGIGGYSGDGGQATRAQLYYPRGLAMDAAGNLYIADAYNLVIRKIAASTGIISTYAGNPTATASGDGGPATSARLYAPDGLALDSAGNLYVSDASTVRKVTANTGIITTFAGSTYGYTGDNGPATSAELSFPEGLAIDSSGNLYIADTGNSVIRKVTAATGIITTVAGKGPAAQYPPVLSGDGGPATSAQLNSPSGVAVDSAGNFYIADLYADSVREVTASNGIIETIAGHTLNYCTALGGDGGPAADSAICGPWGMRLDSTGNLYVAENDGNRIRKITPPGPPPAAITAAPVFSKPAGSYAQPQMVSITSTTPGAEVYLTINGPPATPTGWSYHGPIDVTGSATLQAIAVAPGFLPSPPVSAAYVISNPSTAIISTVAGNGIAGIYGIGGAAIDAELNTPDGIAFDASGNMFIADSSNEVVWEVAAATGTISVFAGQPGFPGYFGDGGLATSASLSFPSHLAFDPAGNLYITDPGNEAIRMVSAQTGIISTYAGGPGNYSTNLGDGGPATAAFLENPQGIATDSAGNLYLADPANQRIRMVSAATGIISTVAGGATNGALGDGGPATSATLVYPEDVALDAQGDIYIADFDQQRVRKVSAGTGIISTIAGNGLAGNSGDGGAATAAQIIPARITVDASGNLYLSDFGATVRKVSASNGTITTVAGNGYIGFSGDGGPATIAALTEPAGLAIDKAGNLYFSDEGNYRVRKVSFLSPAASPTFAPPAGTYNNAQSVTISDAAPGATIYYTTDGSAPTTGSSVYSGPLTVASSETINAIATANGYSASGVGSAAYTISLQNSTPTIGGLSPAFVTAGGAAFTLTVNGSGFVSGSTANLGTTALTTQFVSVTQLTAQVTAAQIASAGIMTITVQNPAPAGASNTLQFEVDSGGATPPSFTTVTATVAPGSTASYPVTLAPSAAKVAVNCLNLPGGAACSYSASAGVLTITTTSSTPAGTYQITVVFTETLPGSSLAWLIPPFFLLPLALVRRRSTSQLWLASALALIVLTAAVSGCGGGSSAPAPAPTHQATTSATVSLTVQ